ncbi:MAG: hypothetical protein IKE59_04490 [Erysipelotrichaceae bacterium]|nr:hypothetical protein [Erysipelotrichaceae bacterium]
MKVELKKSEQYKEKYMSYQTDGKTILGLLQKNEAFRALAMSGDYIYVDGCLCLNDRKYILTKGKGDPELSVYACEHPEECCLDLRTFQKKKETSLSKGKKKGKQGAPFPINGRIYLAARYLKTRKELPKISKDYSRYDIPLQIRSAESKKYVEEIWEVRQLMPNPFPDALKFLCEWTEMSNVDISLASGVSESTISRLKSNEDYKKEKKTLVKICLGMQLPPVLSLDLLSKAGIDLIRSTSKEDASYLFLLDFCYEDSLDTCEKHFHTQTGGSLKEK